jgi:ferric-dicitrate binding protein FerR (iron transport regulator)
VIARKKLIAYEAGTLSEDERLQTEAGLASDDELLRYWTAQRQMDEMLRATHGKPESRAHLRRSIMEVVSGDSRDEVKRNILQMVPSPSPRRRVMLALAGLAAAACIVFGIWSSMDRGIATVIASANCTIERARAPRSATRGFALRANDTANVADLPGAVATIEYRDATRLVLGPKSRASFALDDRGGKRVTLFDGTITAQVSKQTASAPMIVHTPHAVLTVVGTAFVVLAGTEQTRLQVKEGLVRMERADGSDAVEVGAGQSAVFMPGTIRPPAVPADFPLAKSKNGGRSLFMWPFAADSLWNRALGANARFEPVRSTGFNLREPLGDAIIGRPVFNEVENFPVHRVIVNGQPVLDVRFADRWKAGFAADWPVIVIAHPLGMRVTELRGADRLPSGELTAKEVRTSRLDGPGTAGLAESGVSALGGVIRYGELTRGIPHALAASVRKDALGGNLRLGTRLALPPSLDVTRLGTGNVDPGVKLAHALQDYGVFITDTGEQPFALFAWYENTPPDLAAEITALLPYLQVVTDPGDPPRVAPAPPP